MGPAPFWLRLTARLMERAALPTTLLHAMHYLPTRFIGNAVPWRFVRRFDLRIAVFVFCVGSSIETSSLGVRTIRTRCGPGLR